MYQASEKMTLVKSLFDQVPGLTVNPEVTGLEFTESGAHTGSACPDGLIILRVENTSLTPAGINALVNSKGWTNVTLHRVVEPGPKHPEGQTFIYLELLAS